MGDALSLPMAEVAVLLGEGKLKARALAEERSPITNVSAPSSWHIRNGRPSMRENAPMPPMPPLPLVRKQVRCKAFRLQSRISLASWAFQLMLARPNACRRNSRSMARSSPPCALATIMGKTHMVEFAFGPTGHNAHYGSPRNPWDATAHREPGGSSSGAGVSLCEGSALLAFGSDTAASVRLPAAMTGNAARLFGAHP